MSDTSNHPKSVVTRIAPSPTGDVHVGTLSIALKNYAFAKKHHGKFILRIEDTDQKREIEGAVEKIENVLKEFNLHWDEKYIQSERLALYQQKAKELVDNDKAYYCFCSAQRLEEVRNQMMADKKPPRYDGHCRSLSKGEVLARVSTGEPHVIRLKVPENITLTFTDLIRGKISFNSSVVDDQVLLKSDGFPTYHLAVVIDDNDMEVTHVFRGEEWISSAPKHVLLYQAFGYELPIFCHFPVYLNPDGKGKMSKRKGTVSVESFLSRGYLPEALLNFLMILGWAPKDENELMNLERYINEFNPEDVSAKSVVFDIQKLNWLNGIYIRQLADNELMLRLVPYLPSDFPHHLLEAVLPLIKERLVTLADFEELTDFFYRDIQPDRESMLKKSTASEVIKELTVTLAALERLDSWTVASLEQTLRDAQVKHEWKAGQFFMLLRLATTAKKATPPLFDVLGVLGKETVLARLSAALKLCETQPPGTQPHNTQPTDVRPTDVHPTDIQTPDNHT